MSLKTATEEIAKSDRLWESSDVKGLRTQQEADFGLWGPHEFSMPEKEGPWEKVTTNSPKVLANKIRGLLASSFLQLYIDVGEEVEKGRKEISNTERLANGIIWLADREAISVPSGKKIQSALVTHAVLRGGTAKSLYWYTDDKDKKPRCSIKVYDPEFCQWIEAENELLWFCYRNFVSRDYIEQMYPKQVEDGLLTGLATPVEPSGRLLTYTFWDKDEWKVACNGRYIDGDKHGLEYIPINIRSCGSSPYLQSETYQDTMKWAWESVFANNRGIYDIESKLLSIELSKALESGKIKIAGEWDSNLSGNKPPEGLVKLGYGSKTRNEVVLFDAAKGQKFGGMVQPPTNEIVDQFLTRVRGMDIIGSIDPIAFGQMTRSGSGALAAELRAAALEFISPFRECVQDDFIWLAEEGVRQFKRGQFDKVGIEGRDGKRVKFYQDISSSDVVEKHFDCDLVPDRLRDKIQELGAAIQQVSYGLTSKRTARLQHNIVDDPDKEQDIMDEEEASHDPVFQYRKMAAYFKDKGEDELASYYEALSRLVVQQTIQKAIMADVMSPGSEVVGNGKKPAIVSPQMEAERVATEGQQEIRVP